MDISEIPGVFNLLYINQSVKVNFIGYLIVDFLRWIFYAAAKQAKLSGKMSKDSFRKEIYRCPDCFARCASALTVSLI